MGHTVLTPRTSTKLVTFVYYSFTFSLKPRSALRLRKLQWASWFLVIILWNNPSYSGACGGAVGWSTALQVARLRVRFPMLSLEFFHWHKLSGRTMALGSTQPLTEMSTRNISWGYRRPVSRADKHTTFMCRMSWNLEASTSWNPLGLSRPVMELLYLYLIVFMTSVLI
jgi:hypothetical protein